MQSVKENKQGNNPDNIGLVSFKQDMSILADLTFDRLTLFFLLTISAFFVCSQSICIILRTFL